jgi:hypothetical protein
MLIPIDPRWRDYPLDSSQLEHYVSILDVCPPIVVHESGHVFDGHHRLAAARSVGRTHIRAIVLKGIY